MKHLYLIGGTMGVGKTSTSQILKQKLNYTVFLDGDWCWDMSPFQVTLETKKMVLENIIFLLNNFIHCSAYEHIIFCWVMHEQEIIDQILSKLDTTNCKIYPISLICSKESLREQIQKDIEAGIRTEDVISRSLQRIPLYENLDTIKIDVSTLLPEQVAEKIIELGR
ncbi:MAG: AAA family ATPase [Hungatella sp.]|nr:AAA family ATPase [Hungatella sp.]